jgi:hypothetical protein
MRVARPVSFAAALALAASACGGRVIVDHGGQGGQGAGGSSPTGSGAGAPACDAPAIAPSNGACFTNVGACNPVTGAPCQVGFGESCDIGPNGFACFASGNDRKICETCDNQGGPFCLATMTCLDDGRCARYCCDDGDCGTGFCDKADPALAGTGVGVCKAFSH